MSSLLLCRAMCAGALLAALAGGSVARGQTATTRPDEKKPIVNVNQAGDRVEPTPSAPASGIVLPENTRRVRGTRPVTAEPAVGEAKGGVTSTAAGPTGATPAPQKVDRPDVSAASGLPAAGSGPAAGRATLGGGYISVPLSANGPAEVLMADGTCCVAVDQGTSGPSASVYSDGGGFVGAPALFGGRDGRSGGKNGRFAFRRLAGAPPHFPPVDSNTPPPLHAGRDNFNDAFRDAQVSFSRAAYPNLRAFEQDTRAQLRFHAATLTPGVKRGPDGLQREVMPVRGRNQGR